MPNTVQTTQAYSLAIKAPPILAARPVRYDTDVATSTPATAINTPTSRPLTARTTKPKYIARKTEDNDYILTPANGGSTLGYVLPSVAKTLADNGLAVLRK